MAVSPSLLSMARDFRPMTLPELMDRSIELYRSQFGALFGLAMLGWGPLAFAGLGWLYYIYYNRSIWGSDAYIAGALPLWLAMSVGFALLFLSRGAQIHLAFQQLNGQEETIGGGLRWSFRRGGTFLALGAAGLLCAGLAGSCFLFPAVLFLARYGLCPAIAAIEPEQVYFRSLARSRVLWRGSGGKSMALFCTFRLLEGLAWLNLWLMRYVVVYLAHILLDVDLSFLHRLPYGSLLLLLLALLLLHPLKSCVSVLLYIDARIRLEGWDLKLRVEEMKERQAVKATERARRRGEMPNATP